MEKNILSEGEKVKGLIALLRNDNRFQESHEIIMKYENKLNEAESKARRFGIRGFDVYKGIMENWFEEISAEYMPLQTLTLVK